MLLALISAHVERQAARAEGCLGPIQRLSALWGHCVPAYLSPRPADELVLAEGLGGGEGEVGGMEESRYRSEASGVVTL